MEEKQEFESQEIGNLEKETQAKKDWQELENWNLQQEQKMKEKYGTNIIKEELKADTKKIDKITNVLSKAVKGILILHIMIIISLILFVAIYFMGIKKSTENSNGILGGFKGENISSIELTVT